MAENIQKWRKWYTPKWYKWYIAGIFYERPFPWSLDGHKVVTTPLPRKLSCKDELRRREMWRSYA